MKQRKRDVIIERAADNFFSQFIFVFILFSLRRMRKKFMIIVCVTCIHSFSITNLIVKFVLQCVNILFTLVLSETKFKGKRFYFVILFSYA